MEQGFGDIFMFARFLPFLKVMGGCSGGVAGGDVCLSCARPTVFEAGQIPDRFGIDGQIRRCDSDPR